MRKRHFSFLFALALAVLLGSNACRHSPENVQLDIRCDAEELTENGKAFVFDKFRFGNGGTRSDEKSFAGKYAVKLTEESPFGMTFTDKNSYADAYYDISVWRYGKNGVLVLSDEEGKIYVNSDITDSVNENGWERLRLRTFIPPTFEKGDIKIYVWNIGGEAVFFDDLHITRQKEKKYPTYEGDVLDLEIDSLGMDKIRAVRYTAFIRGTLQSDEWVKAKIKYRGKVMPVKLRLKGDWLDHLQGEKWSFRIKLKKGYAWNRLREFSIQNPATRNFLAEWTLHRLLEKEDVLTTRYGFVPVRLNGKTLGIYAWEEHFVKQLLEARSRKEAPVIRFTEDAFWDWISFMEAKDPVMRYLPKFDAADILPFKQKSTISSPSMKALFITGQNLLWQLKQSSRPVGELINTDALAKYYAITSLTCAYHGLAWHNMRFYINPYTQMLDPIAFDGYPGSSISDDEFERILGFNKEGNCVQELKDREEYMLKGLLNDTVFRKQYESYLDAFSGPAYMDTFMVQIRDDALKYEGLIRREFPSYKYNYSMLKDKAALLRAALATDEQQYCRISYRYAPDTLATDTDYCTLEKPLKSMAVKAFLEHERNGQCTLTLLNYHCRPLKIKGTGAGGLITSRIPVEVVLPPKDPNGQPGPVQIESRAGATQVFYSEVKGGPVYMAAILPWGMPGRQTVRQQMLSAKNMKSSYFTVRDTLISFSAGLTRIRNDVVIPKGYRVLIPAGATLDITDSARFISFSPLDVKGSSSKPVLIRSSDATAGGFSIIAAAGKSHFSHATFERLSALDYKGWALTGAVTFYESPAEINNCMFRDNISEDALNLVRCDFSARGLQFENTQFDALDCDFCTGSVDSVFLRHIGNDGLDFSGSEIRLKYCRLSDVIDKGISAGEGSHIEIDKVDVRGSNIGVSAKDLSELNISKLAMINCNYGFALFRKKPEYGPATVSVKKLTAKKITTMHVVDLDCLLQTGDEKVKGRQRVDVSAFYN